MLLKKWTPVDRTVAITGPRHSCTPQTTAIISHLMSRLDRRLAALLYHRRTIVHATTGPSRSSTTLSPADISHATTAALPEHRQISYTPQLDQAQLH